MNIIWIGDKNQGNYQVGRKSVYTGKQYSIQGIVLHWMDGTLTGTDAWFNNPKDVNSAHYGIGDEAIHQYVKETDTAYQAGRYEPDAQNSLANLNTIGIEHQGSPKITISNQTYESSAQLVADICRRYTIPCDRDHIKAHKEVSKVATACPGTLDVDRIVKRAQEILSGQSVATNDTINPMPQPVTYSYPTTVKITASIGVHVRTSPDDTNPSDIFRGQNYGSNVEVVGFVLGTTPAGTNNNKWWQLKEESANGQPLFIWSGGTSLVPTIPVTPQPVVETAAVTPTPSVPTVDTSALESQISSLQDQVNKLTSQLQDITAKYNPFAAMGYASVDDVTKALNEKDQTILGINTELTQVKQRNIDLLNQLKQKESEDYTAVQDGIAAVKELGSMRDTVTAIVKELGISKPGVDAIISQIQYLQASATKARNDATTAQNKLTQVLSSDNLKQVEKTGIEWLLGVLHLG